MKKLLLFIIGAMCLISCKKFLQEYSPTDVTPKSTTDFGEILYYDGYPTVNVTLQSWMAFLDDDTQGYNGPLYANLKLQYPAAPIYQWQPDFVASSNAAGFNMNFNTWGTYYQLLLGVNVALQYLDNSTGRQSDKDQFKGEAYTLRAFYHFMLVNIYAKPYNDSLSTPDKNPGIPIRKSADFSNDLLTRNTVKEVYTQIVSDLDSGMYLLDKQKTEQVPYRISHVAAHLLASRIYLYMEDWDKAISHADEVLKYHPQLMDLNTWGGEPDLDHKLLVGAANVESIWSYGNSVEQLPVSYDETYNVSHDLADCFEENDLRQQIAFLYTPDFLKDIINQDYSQMKNTSNVNSGNGQLNNSWRSAEAYLNRAEAYIQKYRKSGDVNGATQALLDLNTLRANRLDKASFTPWTLQPGDKLLQMCRTERRRELFREEMHRWFDLRRYGMPSIKHVFPTSPTTAEIYRLAARDPQYVMPIPDEVLSRNPALVQNPQFNGKRLPE
ncbi:RagB/SusD family nutrient uptake outer membrane protein [Chitinophaga arvensicola]|uniref:SusD family protein n=1 Tax=Chitinophaga arvensicola TaxID=29529 RepID=A0A1I0S6W2_9BACT|nr:RagB/SusD family nutrient uptake outer membrane protein [Chitinophaga arvensicola]SEW51079.1 SusD family protein [Chitinophaga arvensicola]